MDKQKIYQHLRICGLIVVAWLWAAAPVLADEPINDGFHFNSITIESGELPANLPRLPAVSDLPTLDLPYVDSSNWPSIADERAATKIVIENRVNVLRQSLNTRYDSARVMLRSVRSTTEMMQSFVGEPMEVVSNEGTRSVTVNAMAQEMAQGVEYAVGYARAVSAIGPLGLDLVFVFIGLGWIIFVNFITMAIRVIAWFVRILGKALEALWKLLLLLSSLIRVILAIIDILWPF